MKSKISQTAAFVAVKLYGLTLREPYKSQFPEEVRDFYKAITRQLPKHLSWYHTALEKEIWRKFFIWSEELLLPGDLLHIVSRKFYMTRLLDKAIQEGYQQAVILGSGFDHLGYYASQKGILALEMDVIQMIHAKKTYMSKAGLGNDKLLFESIDVQKESLVNVIKNRELLDLDKPTLFITEGFFDYLDLETSEDVLNEIKELIPKARLLTTFFSLDELNPFHRFMFTSGVSLVGERLKLPLNKSEFLDLLGECDYKVENTISYSQMEEDFVRPMGVDLPVLDGFYVIQAAGRS